MKIISAGFPKTGTKSASEALRGGFKVLIRDTGCTLEFDRIHLKEAIVMWPDMHSFLEFDKFEPISNFKFLFEKLITCFVLAI